jgi:hypothetical protein
LDTHGPELGGGAAVCTTILSSGVVNNALRGSAGFFFNGGFNTMAEPDFVSVFIPFCFLAFIPRKNEKQAGSLA